jgi:hypothetical protein
MQFAVSRTRTTMPAPQKKNTNKNEPQESALRRTTRSTAKTTNDTSEETAAVMTTTRGKSYDRVAIECSTHCLSGAQKRKQTSKPTEQPNKRVHTTVQAETPTEDRDNSETAGGATGPIEQGEAIFHCRLPWFLLTNGYRYTLSGCCS